LCFVSVPGMALFSSSTAGGNLQVHALVAIQG
jgi:hypothetical protein